jgi:putative oxidoreductase
MHKVVHAGNGAFALIPDSLIALLARVVMGFVFFQSWLTKVDLETLSIKPSTFYLFANEYNLPVLPPDLAAYITVAAELVLPILLWLGLFTRYAAAAMLVMTLVIQIFVYPNAYIMHGLWAVGLLVVMKYGPGKVSLDHLLWRDGGPPMLAEQA